MSTAGRPLRFLGWFLGGWVCVRAGMLLSPMWNAPDIGVVEARGLASGPVAAWRQAAQPTPGHVALVPVGVRAGQGHAHRVERRRFGQPARAQAATGWTQLEKAEAVLVVKIAPGEASREQPALVTPSRRSARRWSGSTWVLWRPEVGRGAVQAPLLGGSQMGARLDYRLGDVGGPFSLYGRVGRALTGLSSEEAALGLAWRAGSLPFSLLAERRQRIGPGGRNAFALLVAGGFNPREIAPRTEVDGYVQAGVVGLPGRDAFIDGKSSISYRLRPASSGWDVAIGGALSGSAQPGVERLDVGPEVRVRVPIGPASVRLSAEYRARIAGQARPSSGPAITLVSDF